MSLDYDKLLGQFRDVTAPIADIDALRDVLQSRGYIREIPTQPAVTTVAVDGARLVDQRYTCDIVAAQGCAANAQANPEHPLPDSVLDAHILPHSVSSGRASGTMMHAMELREAGGEMECWMDGVVGWGLRNGIGGTPGWDGVV